MVNRREAQNANRVELESVTEKSSNGNSGFIACGIPGQVRTGDLRFRKPPLYPTELPGPVGFQQFISEGGGGSRFCTILEDPLKDVFLSMWGDFAPPDEIGIDFVVAIAPYMHSRARDIEASKQLST